VDRRVTRLTGDGIREARETAAVVSTEVFPRRLTTSAAGYDDCGGTAGAELRGVGLVVGCLTGVVEGRSRDWRHDRLLGGLDAGRFVPAPLGTARTCPDVACAAGALLGGLCRRVVRAVTGLDPRGLGVETGTGRVAWDLCPAGLAAVTQTTVKGDPGTCRPCRRTSRR